jgi:hypothetical protein
MPTFQPLDLPIQFRIRELHHRAQLSLGPQNLLTKILLEPIEPVGKGAHTFCDELKLEPHPLGRHIEVATVLFEIRSQLRIHPILLTNAQDSTERNVSYEESIETASGLFDARVWPFNKSLRLTPTWISA